MMTIDHDSLTVVSSMSWSDPDQGEWVVVAVLSMLALLCILILRCHQSIEHRVEQIDSRLCSPPGRGLEFGSRSCLPPSSPGATTALLFVEGYDAVGVESFMALRRMFQGAFAQLVLASVRPFDANDEDGLSEGAALKQTVERDLLKYAPLAELLDMSLIGARVALGVDPVELKVGLARDVLREFPRLIVFCPRLLLQPDRWYHRFVGRREASTIFGRLTEAGLVTVELPVYARVRTTRAGSAAPCQR